MQQTDLVDLEWIPVCVNASGICFSKGTMFLIFLFVLNVYCFIYIGSVLVLDIDRIAILSEDWIDNLDPAIAE